MTVLPTLKHILQILGWKKTDCFLTICKISVDWLSGCWKKTVKFTKRLRINDGDSVTGCVGGNSRVTSECWRSTGGGQAKNRERRRSHASLACTWNQRSHDSFKVSVRMCIYRPLLESRTVALSIFPADKNQWIRYSKMMSKDSPMWD